MREIKLSERLSDIERERDDLRARLAAAEKERDELREIIKGEANISDAVLNSIVDVRRERDELRSQLTEYSDELKAKVATNVRLHQRINELRAVVERLPKTADGVPLLVGDYVWVHRTFPGVYIGRHKVIPDGETMISDEEDLVTISLASRIGYSTEEAAAAARRAAGEGGSQCP